MVQVSVQVVRHARVLQVVLMSKKLLKANDVKFPEVTPCSHPLSLL